MYNFFLNLNVLYVRPTTQGQNQQEEPLNYCRKIIYFMLQFSKY